MADQQTVAEGQASGSNSRNRRVANSVQAKAQEVLQEDYDKARGLVADAAKSKSYLYPIKGIIYFATHRALWKPLMSRIGAYILLSAGVVTGMFVFTYVPQLAILVFVNGPLAVFTTVLLILNESSTIINFVSRSYLLQEALLDTFDGTLLSRDEDGIVKEGRQVRPGSDPMQKLGKILKNPFERFSPKALIRYLVYLPLNFIPIVGTGIFILLQARSRGHSVHGRYFQLKNWSASRRADWLKRHTGPYTAFGLVATALEMIPFVSIFFTFTNTVGAALWAADIESKNTSMTDGTAPTLRETAKNAE
ncbi:Outer spore wall protein RRT8 [Colletotrichum aenigma]|uniref:Outer spore wall protein RRT8 n=1 Tax=Colletotrichum aenigma TaxID=1215731 RepID=UPI0018733053|nr:Outer spore wall protein RRT8 [Colletotrichum aenigma]KAF5512911.1 Outer spore wall protein RRT8 [Colletotrichum aenigma]